MARIPEQGRWAGLMLSFGAAQFVIVMLLSQALTPNYSIWNDTISALGVGPAALLYNSSIVLLGLLIMGAAFFIWRPDEHPLLPICMLLTSLGAMGAGLFPASEGITHTISSGVVFFFASLSALLGYRLGLGPRGSFCSVVLGAISLLALGLYGTSHYLGLGPGGMERMIAYPVLLWGIGVGVWLAMARNQR